MDTDIKRALTERVSVPVELAGKAFGLGRNSSYKAVQNGELPSIKIGSKFCVPTAWIRQRLGIEPEVA